VSIAISINVLNKKNICAPPAGIFFYQMLGQTKILFKVRCQWGGLKRGMLTWRQRNPEGFIRGPIHTASIGVCREVNFYFSPNSISFRLQFLKMRFRHGQRPRADLSPGGFLRIAQESAGGVRSGWPLFPAELCRQNRRY